MAIYYTMNGCPITISGYARTLQYDRKVHPKQLLVIADVTLLLQLPMSCNNEMCLPSLIALLLSLEPPYLSLHEQRFERFSFEAEI